MRENEIITLHPKIVSERELVLRRRLRALRETTTPKLAPNTARHISDRLRFKIRSLR